MDAQFGYKLLEPYEYGNSNYVFCLQAIFADEVQGPVTESVTYIKWNDTDTDTIKCFIEYTKTSAINKKVWVNGELAWDFEVERSYSRKIDMIK